MQSTAPTPQAYIDSLPAEKQQPMQQLRHVIKANLPKGFEEEMSYGMIGYVVPFSLYPAGYHCNTTLPLPFITMAAQKNFFAIYHMGLYADSDLMDWFTTQFAAQSKHKLDMGKSCIRFKKAEHITFDLIGELAGKITPQQWIDIYERKYRPGKL